MRPTHESREEAMSSTGWQRCNRMASESPKSLNVAPPSPHKPARQTLRELGNETILTGQSYDM